VVIRGVPGEGRQTIVGCEGRHMTVGLSTTAIFSLLLFMSSENIDI